MRPAPAAIVGMGGAVTNLAAVSRELAVYDPDLAQGTGKALRCGRAEPGRINIRRD